MKKFARLFISGLIIVLPITITIYIVYGLITWIDSIFPVVIFPGFGVLVFVLVITVVGFSANIFIGKPIFRWIDKILSGLPLISLMYKATKDILQSLVGQDSRLKIPVAVKMSESGNMKLGFITQEYVGSTFIENDHEYLAVYFPHAYNFSGNLMLVPVSNVVKIKREASSVMKFIVSGGIIDDNLVVNETKD